MGWTILYIAFGIVALWLLGEVLLQYKARLRWRLLAFVGFLCVVVGVLLGQVVIIAAGAVCFATGQTYVTLSFRRGFTMGWALGGGPGESRRRRSDPGSRSQEDGDRSDEDGDAGYPDHPQYADPAGPQGYGDGYGEDPQEQQPYGDPGYTDQAYADRGHDGSSGYDENAGYEGNAGYAESLGYAEQGGYPEDAAHTQDGEHTERPEHTGYDTGAYGTPYEPYGPADPAPAPPPAPPVYEPEPLPDETGSYGVYGADPAPAYGSPPADPSYGYPAADPYATAATASAEYDSAAGRDQGEYAYDGYTPYTTTGQEHTYAESPGGPGGPAGAGYDWQGYAQDDRGTQSYEGYAGYEEYGAYEQQAYEPPAPSTAYAGYGPDPYASTYGQAPADGAWVPQQRAPEAPEAAGAPAADPYAYPAYPYQEQVSGGYDAAVPPVHDPTGNGYDDPQYRY